MSGGESQRINIAVSLGSSLVGSMYLLDEPSIGLHSKDNERLINIFYTDLMKTYKPDRLRLVMIFNPRGGISSKLAIDSDWSARGGEEKYKDWVGSTDEWEVLM